MPVTTIAPNIAAPEGGRSNRYLRLLLILLVSAAFFEGYDSSILALLLPIVFRFHLGLGFWPTVFMLVPLGIPLVLVNAYVAIRAVDQDTVEVARGLGETAQHKSIPRREYLLVTPGLNALLSRMEECHPTTLKRLF